MIGHCSTSASTLTCGTTARCASTEDQQPPSPLPLIRDHPGCLEATDTILPEYGRISVKHTDRIRWQDPPRAHKQLSFQLLGSPSGRSGKGSEGFGGFGLCNDVLQGARRPPHIDPIEDRPCISWRLLESEQQEKTALFNRPTRKHTIPGPLEHRELRQRFGQKDFRGAIQNDPECSLRPMLR
jgi:hypothetical protein